MTKCKKNILITFIFIIIFTTVSFAIVRWIYFFLAPKPSSEPWHRLSITTKYNDNFMIYQKKAWDDREDKHYSVKLYYLKGNKKIEVLNKITPANMLNAGIFWSYKDEKVIAYVFGEAEIVYKTKANKHFEAINLIKFSGADPNKYKYLIPIARIALKNSTIQTAEIIAEFLVRTKDSESKKIIKQYADGKFSKYQLSWADQDFLEEDKKAFKDLLKEQK